MPATIVLLNGVGSAGKGSIAKALQNSAASAFLHVEMDAFMAMLPEVYFNHPDGMSYERVLEDGKPSVTIKTGVVAERALAGMRRAVAALAEAGNNLIVDEVLFGNITTEYGNAVEEYRTLLAPFKLHWVGVHASLDVLEERERRRGDRQLGFARAQYGVVHRRMRYDLEIDSSDMSPEDCAAIIRDRFGL